MQNPPIKIFSENLRLFRPGEALKRFWVVLSGSRASGSEQCGRAGAAQCDQEPRENRHLARLRHPGVLLVSECMLLHLWQNSDLWSLLS